MAKTKSKPRRKASPRGKKKIKTAKISRRKTRSRPRPNQKNARRKTQARRSASKKKSRTLRRIRRTRTLKRSSKTKKVFSKTLNRSLTIQKERIQLRRSVKISEHDAREKINVALQIPVFKAYETLKSKKRKIRKFLLRFEFKGNWIERGSGELAKIRLGGFSIGLAEIKTHAQFAKYLDRVVNSFAERVSHYESKGFESLSITGCELDGYP